MRWLLAVAAVALLTGSLLDVRGASHPRRVAPAVAHPRPKPKPRPRRAPAHPPQFIVVSFDGSGGARLWQYWRGVARKAHAHFTFFVSGAYLLDWAHHDEYAPPEQPRGDSAIGFAPNAAWIAAMRRQIALGYREGNEVGSHYIGHFCVPGGVATW